MTTAQHDTQVERLFETSFTKAIEEHAPEELDTFSRWFDPGARRTRFHVASIIGAVGYLRRNPALYRKVITSAGRTASEGAYADFSPIERRLLETLPRFGRERLLKHLLHSGLRAIHKDAQLHVVKDDGRFTLLVTNSMFCHTPADNEGDMRCHFYAALFAGLLDKTDLNCVSVRETSCRGQGADQCRFEVVVEEPRAA